jgi:NADPH:quinone reductase
MSINESRGVVIDQAKTLKVGSLPLRELGVNDVLVKIHSAPINPSDVMFSRGLYPAGKDFPTFVGFEGSGLVIQTGTSALAVSRKDVRVAIFASGKTDLGTWGEYIVVDATSAFPIPGDLTYEEAASSLVNPLSVQAMIIKSKAEKHTAIVHSAAASALGKMLVAACKQNGITLINLVRREEQVKVLKDLGAEIVLNSASETFDADVKAVFAQHKPSAFFDAVGGSFGSKIFQLLPDGSKTYNYGALAGEPYTASPVDLLFKNKVLAGFWISTELKNPDIALEIVTKTFENLATRTYTTTIAKKFPFEQYEEAMKHYTKNMTEGKVLIQNPNF